MNKFPKAERICNRIAIDRLFAEGERFLCYPFSVRYLCERNVLSAELSVLINAPKRYQKLAVNRNKAKRTMREAYRLSKSSLQSFASDNKCRILLSIILISKDIPSFGTSRKKIEDILACIEKRLKDESD